MDKYQKVGVCGLIIRDDGKYLVVRRSKVNDFRPNVYDLPGGSVEFGEDLNLALSREILEETSLKVDILGPVYVVSELQKGVRHQIWIIYKCRYIGGEIKLNPEEHDEYMWATLDELASLDKIIFLNELYKNVLSK